MIRTDQQSLKFLLEQRKVGEKYQRWVSKLLGYHFTIVYKPGITNNVADALSRVCREPIEFGSLISVGVPWVDIHKFIDEDDFMQRLKIDMQNNMPQPKGYE